MADGHPGQVHLARGHRREEELRHRVLGALEDGPVAAPEGVAVQALGGPGVGKVLLAAPELQVGAVLQEAGREALEPERLVRADVEAVQRGDPGGHGRAVREAACGPCAAEDEDLRRGARGARHQPLGDPPAIVAGHDVGRDRGVQLKLHARPQHVAADQQRRGPGAARDAAGRGCPVRGSVGEEAARRRAGPRQRRDERPRAGVRRLHRLNALIVFMV